MPFFNTLTNYTLSENIIDLYPISIHCRGIFTHSIKSQQFPQALYITAGVVNIPRPKSYPRGRTCKKKSFQNIFFSEFSNSAEKESFIPLPIFIHCRTHSAHPQNLILSEANQKRAPKTLSFFNQSELIITSPESSANQNRVLRHPRALD